jgi:hypothetical protein
MLHIYIDTVPHSTQRYPTVGDYFDVQTPGMRVPVTNVRISDMQDEDCEFLVAIHELIEQHLCKKRGISEESITAFDMIRAPYNKEHVFATSIEKLVAAELGVDWDEYDKTVNSL